jgi:hypothetical protein
MKSYRHLVLSAALAGFIAIAASASNASSAQTSTTAPVVVRQSAAKPAKSVWLKAEVVHADRTSIVVREQANLVAIHTFTYSARLKQKMESLADQGGFQSGDKVKILYLPGQSVALKVHGKPSKPL